MGLEFSGLQGLGSIAAQAFGFGECRFAKLNTLNPKTLNPKP